MSTLRNETGIKSDKKQGFFVPMSNLLIGFPSDGFRAVLIGTLIFTLVILLVSDCYSYTASYYTKESCQKEGTSGVWTASNEPYNENDLTCAMRSRDFGKYYRITNLGNNKSVIVRHNDFGPSKKLYEQGRIIDLSRKAFEQIADLKEGVIQVKIELVK